MSDFSLIDWAVCLGYLVVVFGLALLSSKGQQSNEEYFVGGRKMNWWVVGISMFATSFSAISFLGLPQRGAYEDFSFLLTILFIPFVITPLLCWIFIPIFVRLKVSSGYEYLGRRFGHPARLMGSGLYCFYALGWMGTMLYAVALTLQVVFGLSEFQHVMALVAVGLFATVYTVLGGLKAVIWTDFLQAIVMGGAIVLILLLAVARIDGGWGAFVEQAMAQGKFKLVHLQPGWANPANFTERNSAWTAAAFGLFMYLPGYAVSQNMIQRYVCAGSVRNGRAVAWLSAGSNTVLGLLFLLVGVALFVFYSQPGGEGLPVAGMELASEDQILPYFVAIEFPGLGLSGLILAGLFAAAMSTMDSGINGVTSVIVFDWLSGRKLSVRISRMVTFVLGLLVIVAALMVPVFGNTVLGIINGIAGSSLGMLLAVFLLGMLVPRANLAGSLIGFGAGLAGLILVWGFTEIPSWWYGLFTILPTFVVGWLASLAFVPPAKSALNGTLFGRGDKA